MLNLPNALDERAFLFLAMIKKIVTKQDINQYLKELADALNTEYKDKTPLIIGVLNASYIFIADLTRLLKFPYSVQFLRSSYIYHSKGQKDLNVFPVLYKVRDRDVILLDCFADTGNTLNTIKRVLLNYGACSVTSVALIARDNVKYQPDVVGVYTNTKSEIAGYGIDVGEQYRNLNFIAEVTDAADC